MRIKCQMIIILLLLMYVYICIMMLMSKEVIIYNTSDKVYDEHRLSNLDIDYYYNFTELYPNSPDVFYNFANVLKKKGLITEAEINYNKVLKLNSTHVYALNNLGNIKNEQGNTEEAVRLYNKALNICSEFSLAHYNLALILQNQNKFTEAIKHYQEVVRIQPTNLEAYYNMGESFKRIHDTKNASKCYSKVIEINPEYYDAHENLAKIYADSNNLPKLIASLRNILKFKPESPTHYYKLVLSLQKVCDWTEYDSRFIKLISIITTNMEKPNVSLFHPFESIFYPMSHSFRKIITERYAKFFFDSVEHLINPPYNYVKEPARGNRLRIGYVSADFGKHPVSHAMQSIPGLHNRENVEIYCYTLTPDNNSTFRSKIKRESDYFVDLSNITCHRKAADIINNDGIHILVNMNGYTSHSRSELFALRPAPIQIMWLGFPSTSGASYIDYLITDKVTSPVEFESQYTEKLAYMPHTYFIGDHKQMYPQVLDRIILSDKVGSIEDIPDNVIILNGIDLSPIIENSNITIITQEIDSETIDSKESKHVQIKVIELPIMTNIRTMNNVEQNQSLINDVVVQNGLATGYPFNNIATGEIIPKHIIITTRRQYGFLDDSVIYCNFNQLIKIDPTTFQVWINILKAVPNSVLWLLKFPSYGEPNIHKQAFDLGIEPSRIVFTPTAGKEEHIRRGQLADICLDTYICNGHTTSMDILWAGIPVVTLPGEKFASRVTASLLTTLGCPELIARTREEYQDIAIKLGTDKKYLKLTRAKFWRARTESPLFDCSMFTNDLERLYRAMWDRHRSGEKLDHILSIENS